jgi:hypothetical protein
MTVMEANVVGFGAGIRDPPTFLGTVMNSAGFVGITGKSFWGLILGK